MAPKRVRKSPVKREQKARKSQINVVKVRKEQISVVKSPDYKHLISYESVISPLTPIPPFRSPKRVEALLKQPPVVKLQLKKVQDQVDYAKLATKRLVNLPKEDQKNEITALKQ